MTRCEPLRAASKRFCANWTPSAIPARSLIHQSEGHRPFHRPRAGGARQTQVGDGRAVLRLIYYLGNFKPYAPISGNRNANLCWPSRARDNERSESLEQGARLARRLEDHRKNIGKATSTLDLNDFH